MFNFSVSNITPDGFVSNDENKIRGNLFGVIPNILDWDVEVVISKSSPAITFTFGKKQNDFRRNRTTTSQILTIRRILEGVRAKNLQATILFVDFTKAFDSIHRGKREQILLVYGLPKETVAAIMILYGNIKVKVHSPDGDTDYFDIVAVVCQETHLPHTPLSSV